MFCVSVIFTCTVSTKKCIAKIYISLYTCESMSFRMCHPSNVFDKTLGQLQRNATCVLLKITKPAWDPWRMRETSKFLCGSIQYKNILKVTLFIGTHGKEWKQHVVFSWGPERIWFLNCGVHGTLLKFIQTRRFSSISKVVFDGYHPPKELHQKPVKCIVWLPIFKLSIHFLGLKIVWNILQIISVSIVFKDHWLESSSAQRHLIQSFTTSELHFFAAIL